MVYTTKMDVFQETHDNLRRYTLEEVQQHDKEDDLWMVIYNKIYDVTSFMPHHPGSGEILVECGGVDATEAFEDVAHSDDALQLIETDFVGSLVPLQCRRYTKSNNPSSNVDENLQKTKKNLLKKWTTLRKLWDKLSILVLTVIAIIAFILLLELQKLKLSYRNGFYRSPRPEVPWPELL